MDKKNAERWFVQSVLYLIASRYIQSAPKDESVQVFFTNKFGVDAIDVPDEITSFGDVELQDIAEMCSALNLDARIIFYDLKAEEEQ